VHEVCVCVIKERRNLSLLAFLSGIVIVKKDTWKAFNEVVFFFSYNDTMYDIVSFTKCYAVFFKE